MNCLKNNDTANVHGCRANISKPCKCVVSQVIKGAGTSCMTQNFMSCLPLPLHEPDRHTMCHEACSLWSGTFCNTCCIHVSHCIPYSLFVGSSRLPMSGPGGMHLLSLISRQKIASLLCLILIQMTLLLL